MIFFEVPECPYRRSRVTVITDIYSLVSTLNALSLNFGWCTVLSLYLKCKNMFHRAVRVCTHRMMEIKDEYKTPHHCFIQYIQLKEIIREKNNHGTLCSQNLSPLFVKLKPKRYYLKYISSYYLMISPNRQMHLYRKLQ